MTAKLVLGSKFLRQDELDACLAELVFTVEQWHVMSSAQSEVAMERLKARLGADGNEQPRKLMDQLESRTVERLAGLSGTARGVLQEAARRAGVAIEPGMEMLVCWPNFVEIHAMPLELAAVALPILMECPLYDVFVMPVSMEWAFMFDHEGTVRFGPL